VILVCSHPDSGEAWWAPVSEILKDPIRRKSRKVDLAIPLYRGLDATVTKRPELLISNLLLVESFPQTIWATPCTVSGNREAGEVLRRRGVFAADWTVLDRTLFSFRRTDMEPFDSIVDGGAEAIETTEWSQSKSFDTTRNFVRLLNQTLADSLHVDLRRHPKRHYLYFRPTEDLKPRILSTGKSNRGRTVFQSYTDRKDPEKIQHFRHHAVDHQFIRLDGSWYLELNPTYHYTFDGYRDLPWGSELVKGMKSREKNGAVLGLVDMWAYYLIGTDNLFSRRDDSPIRFGALQSFMVDRGIDERSWRRSATDTIADPNPTMTLFEAS
jgi:hypothetical protein